VTDCGGGHSPLALVVSMRDNVVEVLIRLPKVTNSLGIFDRLWDPLGVKIQRSGASPLVLAYAIV
jgi:hypothetical protein